MSARPVHKQNRERAKMQRFSLRGGTPFFIVCRSYLQYAFTSFVGNVYFRVECSHPKLCLQQFHGIATLQGPGFGNAVHIKRWREPERRKEMSQFDERNSFAGRRNPGPEQLTSRRWLTWSVMPQAPRPGTTASCALSSFLFRSAS